MQRGLRHSLLEIACSLRTVDCHSHTMLKRDYEATAPFDLFTLTSYFERDIQSTLGPDKTPIYDGTETDAERWERLSAVLDTSRNVSYWRHNLVTYREVFDLRENEVDDWNWERLNNTIRRKTAEEGWYDHITTEVCGLETQVRNIPWFESWEPEYFTGVLRMEPALQLYRVDTRERLEAHLDRSIGSLDQAKEALRDLVTGYIGEGIVGIKLAHAYRRTLACERADEAEASRLFDKALGGANLPFAQAKPLEDHIIHFLADLARDHDLVFQIHTGVQGNWGHIPDSDPLLLIPLLQAYRDVRFDLFHAGYPYSRQMGMLGKHFPNVWLNLAWMYVISTSASRHILSEWLDLVPAYRILGFGSDVRFPELIMGHLHMARVAVSDVLVDKVENDFLSEEEARRLIHKLFRDNAMEFYRLS